MSARRSRGTRSGGGIRFSRKELLDFGVAWLALGLAFAIFFVGGGTGFVSALSSGVGTVVLVLVLSLFTAGVAFLLHELAHKVVAMRFGQVAEFRADYSMLVLAVMSATVGFLFAAPGAVHHQGRISEREHGLVALAGPATNLVLAVPFFLLFLVGGDGILGLVGNLGTAVNLFLAAFNLVPYGPLDGRTVLRWSKLVWAGAFAVAVGVALAGFLVFGISLTIG